MKVQAFDAATRRPSRVSRTPTEAPHLRRSLGLLDVVLMIVAALVSLNTMAPLAQNGPVVLWLWPLAILLFFVPEAITVIELSHHYPGEGAVYVWPSRLLGEMYGFLSGWCYWMARKFTGSSSGTTSIA